MGRRAGGRSHAGLTEEQALYLVGSRFASLAPPLAAGLTHSAEPPLPTRPASLGSRGAPIIVDRNHENFDLLNAYPEQVWHGGRVHVVRPHVHHLMRGQIFEIGGLTWFTMGGASSHDIRDGVLDPAAPDFRRQYRAMLDQGALFRVLGRSWWSEELPSDTEYAEAEANLERAGWCVDCILTHCAPTSVAQALDPGNKPDRLTDFLETVKERCQFGRWFCGHYHVNRVIEERFVVQWEQMSKVELDLKSTGGGTRE